MAKIGSKEIEAAYRWAKEAYRDTLSRADAAKKLSAETGMAEGSAPDYINGFCKLVSGDVYQRTLNFQATEYYLDNIRREFGEAVYIKALRSLEKHLDYHDGLGHGKQTSHRTLLNNRKKELGLEGGNMLKDLNLIGIQATERYTKEYQWRELLLSPEFKKKFETAWNSKKTSKCSMGDYTSRITSEDGLTTDFPHQFFEIANYFVEYATEVKKYNALARSIFKKMKDDPKANIKGSDETKFFTSLRDLDGSYTDRVTQAFSLATSESFEEHLNKEVTEAKDRELLLSCLTKKGWSHCGRTIDRLDCFSSGVLAVAKVVNVSQAFLSDIVEFLIDHQELVSHLNEEVQESPSAPITHLTTSTAGSAGINLIVYGAPGSGKSHFIEQNIQDGLSFRTVFHPEYQNSDFIGGLRPSVDSDGKITYTFVPGPFSLALAAAQKNPDQKVYLIIEEINRANAPAVFGEIFQLLDRDENGTGRYTISADETWKKFLSDEGVPTPVKLPGNLSIYATMNSSDQGVFLLDSAFKRRWQYHYCPIDYTKYNKDPSFTENFLPYNGSLYSWSTFANAINSSLRNRHIEEDRLIGPYFLSGSERQDESSCRKAVSGKLLIYLWDDVLRHGLRDKIFLSDHRTFSDLVKAYEAGKPVFNAEIHDFLAQGSIAAENTV